MRWAPASNSLSGVVQEPLRPPARPLGTLSTSRPTVGPPACPVRVVSSGRAGNRVRQARLHFGVSGHGKAVQAAGDDSQAGGDQQCCSIALSTL